MHQESTQSPADFRITPRTLYIAMIAVIVGAAGAWIAIGLTRMIGFFTNLFFYHRMSFAFVAPYPNHLGAAVIAVPVIGALLVGLMARYGSEKIRGHGIPEAIEAILIGKSVVSPKVALLKPISAAISIGSGGPFGAEGPIIMSGSSFGSLIGQLLHVTAAERKILLLSGAAAGMSATFNAPVASILFVVELLAFEFRPRSIVPIALASGVADFIRVRTMGGQPIFPSSVSAPDSHLTILLTAAAFGIAGSLLAYLLTKAIYGVEDLFGKLPLHWMWWPAIGGVAVGLGGFVMPRALGVGYDTIGQLVSGHFVMKMALLFLLVKAAIWIVALGSGTSGGILAPLLIIGGTLGQWSADVLHAHHPGVWAIMGMAALFAGVTRSPLTSMVFLLELTHDISMMFPTLIASVLASGISAVILPRSILTEKIARRGRHIARDYMVNPLELQMASQLASAPLVAFSESETFIGAYGKIRREPHVYRYKEYPVCAADGRLAGIISGEDICRNAASEERRHLLLQPFSREIATVAHDSTVMSVMHRMLELHADRLIVLGPDGLPIGMVTHRTIVQAGKAHVEEETRRERCIHLFGKSRGRNRSLSRKAGRGIFSASLHGK